MNLWVGLVPAGLKLDSSMAYEESAWCISGGYKYSPPTSSGFRALEHRDMCYGPPLGAAGQRVVMRVDMTKHECSFTVSKSKHHVTLLCYMKVRLGLNLEGVSCTRTGRVSVRF